MIAGYVLYRQRFKGDLFSNVMFNLSFLILFIDKLRVFFNHCHLHFGGGYVCFLCLFCNLPHFHLICSYIFSRQRLLFFSSVPYLLLSFHVLAALCCTCLACLHSASVVLTLVGKSFRIKGKWAIQSSKGRVETVARLSNTNKNNKIVAPHGQRSF